MTTLPNDKQLTILEAAEYLKISAKTLRRWESSGKLIPLRTDGGHRRYTLSQLSEFKKGKKKVKYASHKTIPVSTKPSAISLPEPYLPARYHFENKADDKPVLKLKNEVAIPPQVQKPLNESKKTYQNESMSFDFPKYKALLVFGVILALFSFGILRGSTILEKIANNSKDSNEVSFLALKEEIEKAKEEQVLAATSFENISFTVRVEGFFEKLTTFRDNALFEQDIVVANDANIGNNLTVTGLSTLEGGANIQTLFQIDSITVTSTATELNYLDGALLAQGAIVYSTDTGFTSSEAGTTGQILTSGGTGAPTWTSQSSINAGQLDSLDSTAFLRSDTSDEFTGGTLSLANGTLLDLSAITHASTTPQGIKLPQNTTFSNPSAGEGFIAWDTDDDSLLVFDGSSWSSISGGPWTISGTLIYPTTTTNDVTIGSASSLAKLAVDGDSDEIQLIVQGNSTQNANLAVFEQSDGTDILTISNTGNLTLASGADLSIGSIGLSDVGTDNLTSGATLIGVYDELANSSATNLQDVLDDLDAAIGAGSSKWTQDTGFVYLTNTTDGVTIGGNTNLAKLGIDGDADEIQFLVQGTTSQTANLATFENSSGDDLMQLTNYGDFLAGFTQLDGSTTTTAGSATNSVTVASTANFDEGNYILISNPASNCSSGTTTCYAKVRSVGVNSLLLNASFTVDNGATITEYHLPEVGGNNLTDTVTNRYGRGYFIAGAVTGNGTTVLDDGQLYTSDTTSEDSRDLSISTGTTTTSGDSGDITIDVGSAAGTAGAINIGNTYATSVGIGRTGTTTTIGGSLSVSQNLTVNGQSFSDLTGNGLTLSGNSLTIQLPTATDNLSSTLSSGSGLEVLSSGLTLIQGCSTGQVLKWNETIDSWECANDTGATSAVVNVENNDVAVGTDVDTLDFSTDFLVSASPSNEANISIADDILNFSEFSDSLVVDANTTINLYNGSSDTTFSFYNSDSTAQYLYLDGVNDRIGLGTTGPDAFVDILSTSGEQLRLTYADGTTYTSFNTDTNGDLTIVPSGSEFNITGNLDVSGTLTSGTANAFSVNATGAVTSGSWTATVISSQYGGTGDDTSATTGVPYIAAGNWQYESQLGTARGGTGVDASGATNGQLLIGNGAGFTLAALTESTAIDIANGAGSISVSFDSTELGTTTFGSGSAITWTFDASAGTDTTLAFGDNTVTLTSGTFTVSGDQTVQGGDLTLGTDGADGTLTLYNELGVTDYSVVFQPSASQTEATTYTLPTAYAGGNGYALTSTTGGVMSWTDLSSLYDNYDYWVLSDGSTTTNISTTDTASFTGGTGITTTNTTGTVDFDFDSTEIGTTTWGGGSAITWTFDASAGTDTTLAFGDNTITATSATFAVTGAQTISSTLGVTGITTLVGNLNANGGLDVDDVFVVADGGAVTANTDVDFSFASGENFVVTHSTPTVDAIAANLGTSSTDGVDGLQLTFGVSNASGNVIDITPSYSDTAAVTTSETYNIIDIDAFTATQNATGDTGTINALSIGNLTQTETAGTINATGVNIGTGWDTGVSVGSGGILVADSTPSSTTNKIYNTGGTLYWNGSALASGTFDNYDYWVLSDGSTTTNITTTDTASFTGGTGITTTNTAGTVDFDFASTELNDLTWGDGTAATITWSTSLSGATDPTLAFANDTITATAGSTIFSGDITVQGGTINGAAGESIDLGVSAADTLTFSAGGATELLLTGTNLTPGTAEGNSLGSATAEWEQVFVGDDAGVSFGLDQDWSLLYDETTDDRLELTTANASGFYASTAMATGTAYTFAADSVTTGTGFNLSADALTSGTALLVDSTSTDTTANTTGMLGYFNWNPGSATTKSGDLFRINIGANGNLTNLFHITDNGSTLFRVSETQIESAVPHAFSAAGDVSIAYDIVMSNQTASQIESYGPLSIVSGESFENNNLTLKTYGTGNVVFDVASGGIVVEPTSTGTKLDFDLETEWTTGDLVNVDWDAATTQTAALTGIDIDFTNLTSVASSTTYGIRINDLASQTTSTEYGLYVQGNNWDIGIQSEGGIAVGSQVTLTADSATPSVSGASHFVTANTTGTTITDFSNGATGQIIFIEVNDANTTYDCTSNANFNCGAGDLAAGTGDILVWIHDGTVWNLISWVDQDDTQAGGADLAELYVSSDSLTAGEVVSVDTASSVRVKRALPGENDIALGVVSTNPGIVLGGPSSDETYAIALAGRVPVKFTDENGRIMAGDHITLSAQEPGKVAKLVSTGVALGVAMNDAPTDSNEFVTIFINRTWFDPNFMLSQDGQLELAQTESGTYEVLYDGASINKNGGFNSLLAATLEAGFGRIATLIAPSIQTEQIATMDGGNNIAVQIGDRTNVESGFGKLLIQDREGQTVASIDEQGNAEFNTVSTNEVVADDLTVQSATIAGELRADKIYANEIVGLDAKLADLEANRVTGITREEIEALLAEAESDQEVFNESQTWEANTTDGIVSVNELVSENLFVTETTATGSLAVSDSIVVGADLVIAQTTIDTVQTTSINTLSSVLEIQSAGAQPLSIMAGKFFIDTNGDVTIDGNLAVSGNIQSKGLTLSEPTESGFGRLFNVVDSEGGLVAGISASGSAEFSDVLADRFAVSADNEATSSANFAGTVEFRSNASAGTASIEAGETEVKIINAKLTENSLIYVTPKTSTGNQVLYVKDQDNCENGGLICTPSFVVGFDSGVANKVEFNWWIVDIVSNE